MNYQQLQELYHDLAPRGFTVLAFPCNQVGFCFILYINNIQIFNFLLVW